MENETLWIHIHLDQLAEWANVDFEDWSKMMKNLNAYLPDYIQPPDHGRCGPANGGEDPRPQDGADHPPVCSSGAGLPEGGC